jgi:hypothetical protein
MEKDGTYLRGYEAAVDDIKKYIGRQLSALVLGWRENARANGAREAGEIWEDAAGDLVDLMREHEIPIVDAESGGRDE